MAYDRPYVCVLGGGVNNNFHEYYNTISLSSHKSQLSYLSIPISDVWFVLYFLSNGFFHHVSRQRIEYIAFYLSDSK